MNKYDSPKQIFVFLNWFVFSGKTSSRSMSFQLFQTKIFPSFRRTKDSEIFHRLGGREGKKISFRMEHGRDVISQNSSNNFLFFAWSDSNLNPLLDNDGHTGFVWWHTKLGVQNLENFLLWLMLLIFGENLDFWSFFHGWNDKVVLTNQMTETKSSNF